jgi:hypothetical protein
LNKTVTQTVLTNIEHEPVVHLNALTDASATLQGRQASAGHDSDEGLHDTARNQDRQYLPRLFKKIETKTKMKFTIDGCSNCDGSNALCPVFCCASSQRSFFVTLIAGHHLWLNGPFSDLRRFVRRYPQQKALSPTNTSACIMVPHRQRDSHVHALVKHMQILQHGPAGTVLFNAPAADGTRRELPPCPWLFF